MTTRYAPMFRTAPERTTPVPMQVGDGVQFIESKRWWRVRAVSERFVILTSPLNIPHEATVLYTIIDWECGLRGPDNYYGVGYETQAEIDEALARLHGEVAQPDLPDYPLPQIEVSGRAHSIRVRVTRVLHRESSE